MTIKLKIFNREIEWYDIKTKFKKILRSILYSYVFQELICLFIFSYMWLVYLTGRKRFVNSEEFLAQITGLKPVIISSWHNRLMMMPFIARFSNKNGNKKYRFMALASSHGDGQFVGRVMAKFGFLNVYGSSRRGRKASRGIDLSTLRQIIRGLKSGNGLGITPDGPKGPNQKINSEIINIAKISDAAIVPTSFSASNFIQFNSWDKFKMPLPFSRLNFYFGDLIFVDKNITKEDEEKLKLKLENDLNFVQEKSQEF